ncbi:Hint domain-containing protein [Acetobacter tropicalis]|uniref:Hedgehog/Intein (Hint) domain-containing protein n=1 Tax=Acetobacter tropicalis TaxID=104102 RepID=A0A511FQQ5_9PROT|nr:Hint domain-containing protein [Acetobacter tropicalis]GEL51235.1 hypothetical protein ATR01nite_23100 [Acetobacter tropicalis]
MSTYTWTGKTSNDWGTPSNWSPVGTPGQNDTANIGSSSSAYTVNISSTTTLNIQKIVVSGGSTLNVAGTINQSSNGIEAAAGGTVVFQPGSTTNNIPLTVDSGGTVNIESTTATFSNSHINSGSIVELTNVSGYYLQNFGFSGQLILNNSNVSAASSLNPQNGSSITLNNGSSLSVSNLNTPVTVNGGSTLSLSGNYNGGASVTAGSGSGNTILLSPDAAQTNLTIAGLTNGDQIGIAGQKVTAATYVNNAGNGHVTLTVGDKTYTFPATFDPDVKSGTTTVTADTTSGGNAIICFLAGSMIRTPDGDVAVENIQIGDQVIAFDWKNNRNILRSVVWVGTARAVVRPHLADDEAGWPVRVLKDAVADGVPYKDMLITAEHCLFFEDRFVPVRMLVNGRTIFYDKSILSYDYYHVETELHSVITADGMLTESYLDTGNRSSFRQDGKVASLRSAARSWQDDAGAPLCVDRSFVQPLFHVLEHREKNIAQALPAPEKAALVHDADLRLVTDKGATLRPVRRRDEQYSFMLPSGTQAVRILSRASRPADVIGPFVDDRRQMGVAVGDVTLITAKGQQAVTTHLQEDKPEGWHADMGWEGVAWTDGNALLPLGALHAEGNMAILSLSIRAAGPYLPAADTTQAVRSISIA